ncbi:MAG: hypothetical protein ACFB03_21230 [Paracoccaceae bacterium]
MPDLVEFLTILLAALAALAAFPILLLDDLGVLKSKDLLGR